MKKLIDFRLAGNILLVLFGLLFLFHILVIVGIVPSDIVWAGKIEGTQQLVMAEMTSMFILLLVAAIVAHKMEYISFLKNQRMIDLGTWAVFVLFLINTLGNMTAVTAFEKYVFGLLTLIMAILSLRLAIERKK